MNTPEFDDLMNHTTACAKCHAKHDIYCKIGRELWINNQAAFIADLETLTDRQYWLGVIAKNNPQYIEQIKNKVLERFEGKKK